MISVLDALTAPYAICFGLRSCGDDLANFADRPHTRLELAHNYWGIWVRHGRIIAMVGNANSLRLMHRIAARCINTRHVYFQFARPASIAFTRSRSNGSGSSQIMLASVSANKAAKPTPREA